MTKINSPSVAGLGAAGAAHDDDDVEDDDDDGRRRRRTTSRTTEGEEDRPRVVTFARDRGVRRESVDSARHGSGAIRGGAAEIGGG